MDTPNPTPPASVASVDAVDAGLFRELDARLHHYVAEFSTGSPARALAFYKPNAVIRFRQFKGAASDSATTVRAFTGGVLGALLHGALPASLVLRLVFRQLAKQRYDHSTVALVGIDGGDPSAASVRVLLTFERIDRAGAIFESSVAVYRLEKLEGAWFIVDASICNSLDAPPPSLHIDRFRNVSTQA